MTNTRERTIYDAPLHYSNAEAHAWAAGYNAALAALAPAGAPERCKTCRGPIAVDDRFAWDTGYHAECAPFNTADMLREAMQEARSYDHPHNTARD